MEQDRPVLGILLMLGFCAVAPLADAVAKILGPHVPIAQLLLVRFGVQFLILLPFMGRTGRDWRMSRRVAVLAFVRTILHILGIGMMVTALIYLPLADAVAIAFVLPFIMLLLGHYVLGEEVGMRRLSACAVGFAGTLLIVQPAFADVGWPALLPLGVALNFAVFMLLTRQIARDTDPIALQAVSGGMAMVVLIPLILVLPAGLLPGGKWVGVDMPTWGLLLVLGTLGTLGHLLMTWSLRFAPSATLAPMQYLEIPFATLFGWLVFADLPDGLAVVGILITVSAGLYILIRERAASRALAPNLAKPAPAAPAAE
ncbi:DMT family transporter [Mesobacterium sp. TK19101]|uniref:DMT family transporter n=1 Tax=Mesobacterium hydrothermale TaxID=3111907 RepID=A0ABU6HIP0_9RHOB|nr:DMT family transporter [Mesobacterium sp. TK19101]MEC3862252.1 DMT family transporter [Mesobacterium sp. TK19101]